jgi:hypothetical protein
MKIFKVIVALKTPSPEGMKADFRGRSKDIFDAADFFNNKFARWNKRLFITGIDNNKIDMLLIKEVIDDKTIISPLEIGVFSRFLYHNRQWQLYSCETSKLFKSIMFKEIDRGEALKIIEESGIDSGDRDGVIELLRDDSAGGGREGEIRAGAPDEIVYEKIADGRRKNIVDGDSGGDGGVYDGGDSIDAPLSGRRTAISDELAVKTFQFLLDTQYIGKSSPDKRKAVDRIKSILTQWLEG